MERPVIFVHKKPRKRLKKERVIGSDQVRYNGMAMKETATALTPDKAATHFRGAFIFSVSSALIDATTRRETSMDGGVSFRAILASWSICFNGSAIACSLLHGTLLVGLSETGAFQYFFKFGPGAMGLDFNHGSRPSRNACNCFCIHVFEIHQREHQAVPGRQFGKQVV